MDDGKSSIKIPISCRTSCQSCLVAWVKNWCKETNTEAMIQDNIGCSIDIYVIQPKERCAIFVIKHWECVSKAILQ